MRMRTEIAAVIVLAAVGTALAVGLLFGVAVTRATAADPAPIHCPCPRETINT